LAIIKIIHDSGLISRAIRKVIIKLKKKFP
ncbi:unnamed protein product, partial [marine sediment metagenome]